MHDIGKVGVPDSILKKPGVLTSEEFDEMKKHTTYGRDALLRSEKEMGSTSFLRYAKEIAYSHQEKWDGSATPNDAIPVSARLMAVGDAFDALVSKKVYKPGCPHDEAVSYIGKQKAKHFDPDIVDAFLAINHDFKRIAETFTE